MKAPNWQQEFSEVHDESTSKFELTLLARCANGHVEDYGMAQHESVTPGDDWDTKLNDASRWSCSELFCEAPMIAMAYVLIDVYKHYEPEELSALLDGVNE